MIAFFRRAALVAAALLVPSTAAPGFLAPGSTLTREDIVANLRSLLGHNGNQERIRSLTDALRPTFAALPKDDKGGVSHRVARYALHRYFIVHHAWYIKGLAHEQDSSESDKPLTGMLKSKMPSVILEVMDEELHGKVVGLDELTVLAATIEDLVQSDAVDLLHVAYKFHGMSADQRLSIPEAEDVIKTFALFFLMPELQTLPPRRLKTHLGSPARLYPGWDDVWVWMQDLRMTDLYQQHSLTNPFGGQQHAEDWEFPAMARWASQIAAGVGRFSDLECKAMRGTLVELDDSRMDGRVRLGRFYAPVLDGTSFHFSESPDYLRHLGALDETDPANPSVIVPNVMYARSNCLATSGFHSVCCVDDCEILMTHVEESLQMPIAEPRAVAEAVSRIPSETIVAPRNLSHALLQRLDDIAERHGGRVPLHGRLFAQWMHYAFPNECRHPSTTAEVQMTPSEWRAHWNRTKSIRASRDEMIEHHRAVTNGTAVERDSSPILWSEDEELLSDVAFNGSYQKPYSGLRASLRLVAMGAVSFAGIASMFQHLKSAKTAVCEAAPADGYEWCHGLVRCPGFLVGTGVTGAREDTKSHFV